MQKNNVLLGIVMTMSLALSQSAYADPAPAMFSHESHRDSVLAQLPPEKAKLYKDAISALHSKNAPIYDQIDKLHQDLTTIMTADTFDKAAYIAKNAEIEKAYAQTKGNTTEAIASVAAQFTLDERKTLEKLHPSSRYTGFKRHSDGK